MQVVTVLQEKKNSSTWKQVGLVNAENLVGLLNMIEEQYSGSEWCNPYAVSFEPPRTNKHLKDVAQLPGMTSKKQKQKKKFQAVFKVQS